MTLTSSRISDEFKLIQEILAVAVFGQWINLYSNLSINVRSNGWINLYEGAAAPVVTLRTRDAARYILRRWW